MNKKELVDRVSLETGLLRGQVGGTLETILDVITKELATDGKVNLPGFGVFALDYSGSGEGRNPRTGESFHIYRAKPIFRPGKPLKDAVAEAVSRRNVETVKQISQSSQHNKSVVIRAKMMHQKRVYRDISILGNDTLHSLASAIIQAFDFQEDHAFGFYSDLGNKYANSRFKYELFKDMGQPVCDDGTKGVKDTKVSTVFRSSGKKMQFIFDFGDNWRFELESLGFSDEPDVLGSPRVVATRGAPPQQYPDWDE